MPNDYPERHRNQKTEGRSLVSEASLDRENAWTQKETGRNRCRNTQTIRVIRPIGLYLPKLFILQSAWETSIWRKKDQKEWQSPSLDNLTSEGIDFQGITKQIHAIKFPVQRKYGRCSRALPGLAAKTSLSLQWAHPINIESSQLRRRGFACWLICLIDVLFIQFLYDCL